MNLADLKQKILENKDVRQEYDRLQPEYEAERKNIKKQLSFNANNKVKMFYKIYINNKRKRKNNAKLIDFICSQTMQGWNNRSNHAK